MPKLITASCFLLFWVFYEMSGGADFAPQERIVVTKSPFAEPVTREPNYGQATNVSEVTNASFDTETTQNQPTPVAAEPDVITVAAAPAPAIQEPTFDIVVVAGNRVNLREGPGTNHAILDTVAQGTQAELVATNDDGWAQIRLTSGGQIGWMAERLLSDG